MVEELKSGLKGGLEGLVPDEEVLEMLKSVSKFEPGKFLNAKFLANANDIFITPGAPIRLIKGFKHFILKDEEGRVIKLTQGNLKDLIRYLVVNMDEPVEGINDFAYRVGIARDDGSFDYTNNIRVHLVKQGVSREYNGVILRKLFSYIPDPEDLKVPKEIVNAFIDAVNDGGGGIGLITGKQRQGKTTTIASLLHLLSTKHEGIIITVENPIEYIIPSIRSVVIQKDVITYIQDEDRLSIENIIEKATERALIDVAREYPTVVFVGEVRTKFEVEMVVKLAESGVFVIATFHGETVPAALSRFMRILLSDGDDRTKLATFLSYLRFVSSQRLLPNAQDATRMELVSEYYIPTKSSDNLSLFNALKQRKLDDFLMQFSKRPKGPYVYNFERALEDAVSAGRITRELARAINPYSKILDILKD